MSESESEEPFENFSVGNRVSIALSGKDGPLWRCAMDLTGLGYIPLSGRYKHCNVIFHYEAAHFSDSCANLR